MTDFEIGQIIIGKTLSELAMDDIPLSRGPGNVKFQNQLAHKVFRVNRIGPPFDGKQYIYSTPLSNSESLYHLGSGACSVRFKAL